MLDVREAQDRIEDALRDAILFAFGKRAAAVASIPLLRAVTTQGLTGPLFHDDNLAAVTFGGTTTGYRWNTQSTAADNGTSVIKPDDVTENGRWLGWASPLRIAFDIGGDSSALHELTTGFLERVIVLDRNMDEKEINALIFGQVPSIVIEATDDDSDDLTQATGNRWSRRFHFTISVIAQNLRDRRQAQHGSTFAGELEIGANRIDGLVQALLGGTAIYQILDGIKNVQIGRGYNWISEQGQRRVVRGRSITVLATVEYPQAPNEIGAAEEVDVQTELVGLPPSGVFDDDDYLVAGMAVLEGPGLTKTVQAGSAVIAGVTVAFAGSLYTFTALSETYRDLNPAGTITFVTVPAGAAAPPVTAGALRIGATTTDSGGVVADRIIAETRSPYMNPITVSLT